MLLGMLCTSAAVCAHVCDLAVEARPEHTATNMSKSELSTTMSCMQLVEDALSKRRRYDNTILFK